MRDRDEVWFDRNKKAGTWGLWVPAKIVRRLARKKLGLGFVLHSTTRKGILILDRLDVRKATAYEDGK